MAIVELPDDLPTVKRTVVRLVVLDADERLLLFHTHDPTYPELGSWWELPGGGIEPGETPVDTAMRELLEETGIVVGPGSVGSPRWRRTASFRYRGQRRVQRESVLVVRLSDAAPVVHGSRRVGYEDEDYFGFRWWPLDEVTASAERFYPGRLPTVLPQVLAGREVDEGFELWS
jgi:8-oxo-dGTP pyrophosphatase MutT (NUDIX family)